MNTQLEHIRKEINDLDASIVASLFDGSSLESPPKSTKMTPEDIKTMQTTRLHFSGNTWRLIDKRMQISEVIGKIKKENGLNHIVDEERKKKVIEHAKSRAPEDAHRRIEALYEIIHNISVRIQKEIIAS